MSNNKETRSSYNRYSVAFKMKVVEEVENGILSAEAARKLYKIPGQTSIAEWVEKYGINQRINKAVYVMTNEEQNELIRLRKENKRLQRALDDSHLRVLAWESLVEIAEEDLQVDLKKKLGSQLAEKLKEKLSQSD